jgi:hypothetical protein
VCFHFQICRLNYANEIFRLSLANPATYKMIIIQSRKSLKTQWESNWRHIKRKSNSQDKAESKITTSKHTLLPVNYTLSAKSLLIPVALIKIFSERLKCRKLWRTEINFLNACLYSSNWQWDINFFLQCQKWINKLGIWTYYYNFLSASTFLPYGRDLKHRF